MSRRIRKSHREASRRNKTVGIFEPLERRTLMCGVPIDGEAGGSWSVDHQDIAPVSSPADMVGPNLQITSIELTNGLDQPIAAPVIGQAIKVRARWTSSGLDPTQQYVVRFVVDGVPLESATITGQVGENIPLESSQRNWFASTGSHSVQVTIDANNTVLELIEADNSMSMNFTPLPVSGLPAKFLTPIVGLQSKDWTVVNYLDADPRAGITRDYLGGSFQYDGHNGIDFTVPNFPRMDKGAPVIAAAAGTVTLVRDGNFDRETASNGNPANEVLIDHGNGWQTQYLHLAANTISVKVGEAVQAGQMLGLVGSSGSSTDAHLHFTVIHDGIRVDTGYAPTDYWRSPLPYQGGLPAQVMDSGITNYTVWSDFKERPATMSTFKLGTTDSVWFWNRIDHLNLGDVATINWYKPDNTLTTQYTYNATEVIRYGAYAWVLGSSGWSQAAGTWQVALNINGIERSRQSFVVNSTGVPAMRVLDGAYSIANWRTTPVDFGTVPVGSTTTRTFTIENLGSAALSASDLMLPAGFSLSGLFPSSVAAKSTGNFTIAMNTSQVGAKFGQLNFASNDVNNSGFRFNIAGTVSGSPTPGAPQITLPGPARSYFVGAGPKLIDELATIADSNSANFAGGRLLVELAGNPTTWILLGIRHQDSAAGQIGVSGSTVMYGGAPIGTFTANQGGSLTVNLNSNATVAATQALMRNLTYSDSNPAIEARRRYLRFTLTDETALQSNSLIKSVALDTRPGPRVLDGDFRYQTAPHSLSLRFSQNVQSSVSVADLNLVNVTTGATIPTVAMALNYDGATNTAMFTFPGLPGGLLSEGRYRAIIRTGEVTNAGGDLMAGDFSLDFFHLPGDANHDGRVNLDDFNIVAANFGQINRNFTQGDFNYDNRVNLDDFNILAARFGSVLAEPEGQPLFGEHVVIDHDGRREDMFA